MEVKINEQPAEKTPEAKPAQSANTAAVKLRDGRAVEIRRMGPLHRMRMFSIIGAENSKNEIYLGMAVPAYCVTSIDGQVVPTCTTVLALEAVAERLGDSALLDILTTMGEHFPDANMAAAVEEMKQKGLIKN